MYAQCLVDVVRDAPGRLVAPLMGYPGTQITRTSIKQNEFNWGVHFWTLNTLVREFEPDIIFCIMDLAVEASALGLPVRFPLLHSPSVEYHTVKESDDLRQFMACDILKDGRAVAFIETMKLMSANFECLPGAYCTGPYTLAGLMMGASDIAMNTILKPDLVHEVLAVATHVITRYVTALSLAGAKVLAVLEPTAVMLSPDAFWEFSGRYIARIFSSIHETSRVLHICGNSTHLVDGMVRTGAEGLSLDSQVDLAEVARRVPEETVLIGNLDSVTVMRDGSPEKIRNAVRDLLDRMSFYPDFILSTGCDLPPDTPLENIAAFMEAGREFGRCATLGKKRR
ncbi:MAG: uroporphyrinogen decarboxylase family protein [Planctomycetes bacterium]|nr:uroporphyrinogen decarboxylase family protein [Planctomycetota bacterium]